MGVVMRCDLSTRAWTRAWKRVRRRLLKSLVRGHAAVLLPQPQWDGRAVELEVPARAGATTAAPGRQVRSVTGRSATGLACILIGGNDVMLPAPVSRSADPLGHCVRELRSRGWEVVVGSCADEPERVLLVEGGAGARGGFGAVVGRGDAEEFHGHGMAFRNGRAGEGPDLRA